LEKQHASLLPIPYFHLVFTLPHLLNPLVRQNRKVLYKLLFDSAARTLLEFGQRRFGGDLGLTAVLHTWSQNLGDHYHVHCIVTGGALSAQGWKSAPAHYLFSVRALSVVFRGKFCSALASLFAKRNLELQGQLEPWAKARNFRQLLRQAAARDWVVYAKKPFGGPRQVLEYLSLYTHRVALSERRLLALDQVKGTVNFSYKDYADGAQRKIMSLQLEEFIRRFLLHVLPERFVKIRHYGILGNHGRNQRLERVRALLNDLPKPAATRSAVPPLPSTSALLIATLLPPRGPSGQVRCPFCGGSQLRVVRIIFPAASSAAFDSS
jgi:hypothetical protein